MAVTEKVLVRTSDGRAEDTFAMEDMWSAPTEWDARLATGYTSEPLPGGELKALRPDGDYMWKIVTAAWVARVQADWDADAAEQPEVDKRNDVRGAGICQLRSDRAELSSSYFTGHSDTGIKDWAGARVTEIDSEIAAIEGDWE